MTLSEQRNEDAICVPLGIHSAIRQLIVEIEADALRRCVCAGSRRSASGSSSAGVAVCWFDGVAAKTDRVFLHAPDYPCALRADDFRLVAVAVGADSARVAVKATD